MNVKDIDALQRVLMTAPVIIKHSNWAEKTTTHMTYVSLGPHHTTNASDYLRAQITQMYIHTTIHLYIRHHPAITHC